MWRARSIIFKHNAIFCYTGFYYCGSGLGRLAGITNDFTFTPDFDDFKKKRDSICANVCEIASISTFRITDEVSSVSFPNCCIIVSLYLERSFQQIVNSDHISPTWHLSGGMPNTDIREQYGLQEELI